MAVGLYLHSIEEIVKYFRSIVIKFNEINDEQTQKTSFVLFFVADKAIYIVDRMQY